MVELILQSLAHFQPEVVLTSAFLLAILAEVIFPKKDVFGAIIAIIGMVAAGYFVLYQTSGPASSVFSNMIAVDPFSAFFKLVILLTGLVVVAFSLMSKELKEGAKSIGEYYALLLALTLGMFLMTGAANLLMVYLAIELTSISSYILTGYTKEAPDSSEASLKYVIYGAVASGMMLYGISILYGLTGATDIYGVNRALTEGSVSALPLIAATVLVIVGFGYKITAVPFHFWSPDVYEGAPLPVTAILAVASKAAGFAVLIRFFTVAFVDSTVGNTAAGFWSAFEGFEWQNIIAAISVLTMTVGNLIAVWQKNLKRLLAYSSIAHAGYLLMGVVVLNNEGIAAVLIYFVVYLFMNLGAFYVVMLVANKTGSEDIDTYRGLGYRSPLVAVSMAIFLIALTGLPPTAGFIGKLYLFAALINAKWIWLAVVGAANSVVSLYYYVRIFRNMFLRDPDSSGSSEPIRFGFPQVALLLVLVVPTIVLGLYFGGLVEFAQASVVMFTGR
jgi:NADH-quinone oxidoreductase subunit N